MTDFFRPEARAALWRWREAMVAGVVAALGLWWALTSFGVLQWLGWALVALAAAAGYVAIQRLRFGQGGGGPGVVQIDERRLSYFGPLSGGIVDLDDLVRLDLDPTGRPPHWVLSHRSGDPLPIPVNAEGADALFDVFATLPGIRTERMLDALRHSPDTRVTIWQARPSDLPRLN
jgi:hypothetical protein